MILDRFGGLRDSHLGNLGFLVAHLSTIITRLLPKLHAYQFIHCRMYIKGSFDLSDSLFSLRLSGFIFRSGNFLPDPVFLYLPEQTNTLIIFSNI